MKAKTYKREIAASMLIALIAMAVFAMTGEHEGIIMARAGIVSALALPIMGFAAAAFGMDWVGKQTTWGGEPERAYEPGEPVQ